MRRDEFEVVSIVAAASQANHVRQLRQGGVKINTAECFRPSNPRQPPTNDYGVLGIHHKSIGFDDRGMIPPYKEEMSGQILMIT